MFPCHFKAAAFYLAAVSEAFHAPGSLWTLFTRLGSCWDKTQVPGRSTGGEKSTGGDRREELRREENRKEEVKRRGEVQDGEERRGEEGEGRRGAARSRQE